MYTIPDISPELIIQAAEAVYFLNRSVKVDDISTFLGLSYDYAEKAVKGAVDLELIAESGKGHFSYMEPVIFFVSSKRMDHPALFRFYLERFPPFKHFKQRIICQVESLQAAREIKALYNIPVDPQIIKDTLINWGTYAGALRYDETRILTVTSTDYMVDTGLATILERYSQINEVEQHIRKQWSPLTNNSVPRPVLDNLIVGYSKFINEEPFREVILPIGNGFEDYLKHIASTRNPSIDLTGCNGIIQIGEKLKSNGIIAKKHLGAIGFIGHLRNSADHGIDSEVGKEWQVRRETLLSLNIVTWNAIDSISLFCDGRKDCVL